LQKKADHTSPTIQADCGGLLKRLSVQLAGRSGFNIFEPSLSTQTGRSRFPIADTQRLS
jgi:hypothetical protein